MYNKFIAWLPVLLWMGIIFTLSSFQAVKSAESYWLDFSFKKLAHMIEYGVLWWLSFRALRKSTKLSGYQSSWIGLVIAVLYAMSDEYHQTLVPSREGTVRDVIIDTTGALLTMGGVNLFLKAERKAKH